MSSLPLKQTPPLPFTEPQQKIWEVLQEDANRTLSIRQICQKAGYDSTQPWYTAMQAPAFRAHVLALGVVIEREPHSKWTVGRVPLTPTPDEEWAKDTIDVRRLVPEYPKHIAGTFFKLDFSRISSAPLRSLVKRYFRARMGFWEPRTFKTVLTTMIPFFVALSKSYPHLDSFASLTREMVEPLLTLPSWIDARGQTRELSVDKRARMVTSLRHMWNYMLRHEWEGAPRAVLIYEEDRPKRSGRKRPRPIPPLVFDQIQAHAHLLPPYAHNLVVILSHVGLRAEDALHLPENCLEYDATGEPRLHWFNHKLKRDGRPLPVTTAVAEAIDRQRLLVKEVPDHFGKRYLFRTSRGLCGFEWFCHCLDVLAEQVPICGEDQHIYYFTPHQFRHSVGTQMINGGMGIADVMAYLDHASPEMTLRYVEISDDTLKQKFKALVLSGQAVGGASLKALREQLEQGDESELDWVVANLRKLSLPWGQCLHHAKANKCPYGQNACFTKDQGPCHKLVTTPSHAPVIRATMQDLKKSKQIADERGWEMYATDLSDQIKGMEQVLAELQLPVDQRSKNRGGTK